MKRINILFVLVLIFGCTITFANIPSKISLIAKQCRENESPCSHQKIIRLNFENGEYVGKEVILETDKVRFDLGENRIYQNRYLISSWGDVVDLKEKKILHESEGKFFRLEGDKVFIQVNREDKDGLYLYDLKTRKYSLYKKTDDRMFFGKLSPNGIRSADWTCPIDKGCGIEINSIGKEEIFIEGFTAQVDNDGTSSEFLDVPVFWLDNERLLTQKSNGELVIVNINGKISHLLKIKLNTKPNYNPTIFRGINGKIYYTCNETFEIDIKNRTATRLDDNLRNGFTRITDGVWKSYLYKNKSIGKFRSSGAYISNGYLATHYLVKNQFQGYYDGSEYWLEGGIKIWNTTKKDWVKIEVDWGINIIGWLED